MEAANEKRFGDAERFFNIVLSKDHDSASAWSNLGNVHLSLGKTDQALKDFSNAIELASDVSALLSCCCNSGTKREQVCNDQSTPSKRLLL